MGNIMGSLIGGPVAAFLIAKHGLKLIRTTSRKHTQPVKVPELDNTRMIMMFALCLLLAALGMPIYRLLDNIPMIEMPKFIGCLFAGAIARNVMEAAGIKFYVPEVEAIEHMFLELYLALVLMTTDFTKLAPLAGQMGIVLVAQGIFMALLWNLCILQSLRPRLRRSCHDSRKHRLGLRFRFQCRRKRESDHGPVRLAHHRMGFVSVLCRYHRRYLQPDLPFYLRRLIPFIEIHVTFTKGHLTSLFSPGGIPHFPPGFCPFFFKITLNLRWFYAILIPKVTKLVRFFLQPTGFNTGMGYTSCINFTHNFFVPRLYRSCPWWMRKIIRKLRSARQKQDQIL